MSETKALQARLEFLFPSIETAEHALQALEPDLNRKYEKRSQTVLKANKKVLSAHISASDEKALKASVQSLLKTVSLIQKVQAIKKE